MHILVASILRVCAVDGCSSELDAGFPGTNDERIGGKPPPMYIRTIEFSKKHLGDCCALFICCGVYTYKGPSTKASASYCPSIARIKVRDKQHYEDPAGCTTGVVGVRRLVIRRRCIR